MTAHEACQTPSMEYLQLDMTGLFQLDVTRTLRAAVCVKAPNLVRSRWAQAVVYMQGA